MAEYWKSTPKFWCKQCKIYIRDTGFEKSQHEASGKHQGNLKRFLRDIHRDNDRQQRESEKAKNEVERLRQTVSGPSADKDGNAPPWKRTAAHPPPPPPSERPISAEERKKQVAQLAEMGVSIPDEFRGDMALAGEWQTTAVKVLQPENEDGQGNPAAKSIGVRKRKHEGGEGGGDGGDGEEEPERFVNKGWGSKTRVYPGAQDADEDLDALLSSTTSVKKTRPSTSEGVPEGAPEEGTIKKESSDDVPANKDDLTAVPEADQVPPIKEEEPSDVASAAPEEPAPGVVFKKRKPKAIRK